MVEAKQEAAWDHTAAVMALIFNVNSTKKKMTPTDFHPYRTRKKRSGEKRKKGVPLSEFKRVLVKNKGGKTQ